MTMSNVLIIGASSSIGRELVECFFASKKHNLTATYNKNVVNFADIGHVNVKKLDLLDDSACQTFCEAITEVDVLIILPGLLLGTSLSEYNDCDIDKMFNINATSQIKFIKKLAPKFNNDARIVIMSSISAERGSYDPIYAATKGALISFAKSVATWLGKELKINIVAPSLIKDSTMYNDMSIERRNYHKEQSPTGELTSKQDLARIIFDLVQPHWRNVNGEVIRINGGVYV